MIKLVYIVILFALWAFFAAAETAFISTSRFKLNNLRRKGSKRATFAYFLLERPERLLGTSLVGTNISLVLSANLTALLFFEFFGETKPIVSISILTVASLVFCEIIPKNLAIKKGLGITLLFAFPMYIFYFVFYPVGKLFTIITEAVMRLGGIAGTGTLPTIFKRREDVEIFLTASLSKTLSKDERRYFVDSLDFGRKILSDIIVPLVDITAVPEDSKIKDCIKFIETHGRPYIPVYRGRIDNIVGILYARDIVDMNRNLTVNKVMKDPVFIPENKSIDQLYRELFEIDIPVVFSVDEYGGITGMSTIYDIGEEVIGKISGLEGTESLVVRLHDNEYLCDGDVEIDELVSLLSIDIETGTYTTLNGMMSSVLGRVPKKGDVILTEGYRFYVERGSRTKAELIRISRVEPGV